MREIVLDTETTGLSPRSGHKIVEIGCVEMINQIKTGNVFHRYINPQRDMPEEAFSIHGLSESFLSGKPIFKDIVDPFLEFLGTAKLVIHNAEFDLSFINIELSNLGYDTLDTDRATDTMHLARKRFPGAPANLDALCRRFQIDNSNRQLHGALLDAELLAEVYLELIGGRQRGLSLGREKSTSQKTLKPHRSPRASRPHNASVAELEAHQELISRIKNPIWTG